MTITSILRISSFVAVVASIALQVNLARQAPMDNDEIAYVYDAHLVADGKNPMAFGWVKGFGLWPPLAAWVSFVGFQSTAALKGFSIVLFLAEVLALFLLFRELRQPRAGAIAVLLWSASPYLLNTHVTLHTQNVQIPLLLFGAFLYLRSRHHQTGKIRLLLTGVLTGYAFITRESALFFSLVLSVLLLAEPWSLGERTRRLLAYWVGWSIPVFLTLALLSRQTGIHRIFVNYARYVDRTVGVTANSTLHNLPDILRFMHSQYSLDLLLLFLFGLGTVLSALVSRVRQGGGRAGQRRLVLLLAGVTIVLFGIGLTTVRVSRAYWQSDCRLAEHPDLYCQADFVKGIVAPLLALGVLCLVLLLLWRPLAPDAPVAQREALVTVMLLLVPAFIAYAKNVRFTIAYLYEFYPGIVALAALSAASLLRARRVMVGLVLFLGLVTAYRFSWRFVTALPMSGSYTPEDVQELREVVTHIPGWSSARVFTASTTIVKLLGAEPLLHISHPISYGYPLPERMKFALYPRPEEIVALMEQECPLVILEDVFTQKSYYWGNNPIKQYVDAEFTEVYHLRSEPRTRILVRTRGCRTAFL